MNAAVLSNHVLAGRDLHAAKSRIQGAHLCCVASIRADASFTPAHSQGTCALFFQAIPLAHSPEGETMNEPHTPSSAASFISKKGGNHDVQH
jgi:hypothetical protein